MTTLRSILAGHLRGSAVDALLDELGPETVERLERGLTLLPGCTHYCQGGHFDGDDMTMNEQRGWSLRDRGLGLDGEQLEETK